MTEDELRNLHARYIYDEHEKYDIHYRMKDGYEYLGMLWASYGDEFYYRNKETGETVCVYYSIGD